MKIKVVTDSSCDLTADLIKENDITVVPIYVRFGEEVFKERVNITDEQFYQRLLEGTVHPATIQPGPNDFLEVYEKLAKEADAIISIHISNKLSGTLNSAIQAKGMMKTKCQIEIVDSKTVTVALGIIVLAAANALREGKDLKQVLDITNEAINSVQPLCLLDTLKYLEKGGRIGKAKALVGTILNIKPLITLKDGEVVPAGQVRSRAKGIEQLVNFAKSVTDVKDIAVAYTTTPDDANELAKNMASFLPQPKVRVLRMGTTLGVHTGPGTLAVAMRGKLARAQSQ